MIRYCDAYETLLDYCYEDLIDLHNELVENSLYTGMLYNSDAQAFVDTIMRCVHFHGIVHESSDGGA